MNKTSDILNSAELHERKYEVPQGYFDSLRSSLYLIPQRQETSSPQTTHAVWRGRTGLRIALAACAAVALIVAVGIIHRSPSDMESLSYEQLLLADLIPHPEAEDYYFDFQDSGSEEVSNQDDLYDYLMSGGTSAIDNYYETDY